MPKHNADIAVIFEEIADLLEIQDANPFRIRAYRNAARVVGELSQEISRLLEKGEDLTELPGIGDDLAGKIKEIAGSGHCSLLERLHTELPPTITELLKIPGLGPKRVKAITISMCKRWNNCTGLHAMAKSGTCRVLERKPRTTFCKQSKCMPIRRNVLNW